jgi:O-antigen/teichoic acid export membrane protein
MTEPWRGRGRTSLTDQAAVLAFGALLTQAATLASLVVLTRLVAKPALGGYQQLWLIYGIIAPFLVGGVPTALLYFLPRARSEHEARRWVLDAYVVLAMLGVASSIGILLFRDPIAGATNDHALAGALLVYAPYPFFAFLTAGMPSALIASGRAKLAAMLNAFNGLATVTIVISAAIVSPTTRSMAAGLTISAAIVAVVSTGAVLRVLRVPRAPEWRTIAWRPLLAYGLPLAVTQLAGRLGFQIDRVVVSARYTPAEFAIYAVGAVDIPIAIVVQQAVNSVLVPALARLHSEGDLPGIARLWQSAIRKTSLIMLPLFAFLMIMADSVVRVLYGPAFAGSVPIFRAYLFLLPLRVATYALITQAVGRTAINFTASLVLLATNAVLAVSLVFPLGTLGPAIATPLASALAAAYYIARLRSVLTLRLADLLPWRLLLVNTAVSFAAAVPLFLLFAVHLSPLIRVALGGLLFVPFYAVALCLTGRLTKTEWQLLRTVISGWRNKAVVA